MGLYWGWVVCICFLVSFTLSAGIAFSFNEIIIPLSKEIHSSMTVLDLLGSLPSSLPMLLAPIATLSYYKIGTRKSFIIGVMVTSVSLAFTALSRHVVVLFVVYGIIGGTGITLIVNPPFFLLDEYFPYFHPRHVLATSVIACAFPIATLLFNPLTYALISSIGWRGSYSVLAVAMFVIGILTSITLRNPDKEELSQLEEKKCQNIQQYDEIEKSNASISTRTKVILGAIWTFASFCKGIGYYTPYLTLIKQMEVLGISQYNATITMAVVGVCELFSRFISSYAGDYIKGKMLYAYVMFCALLSILNALATMASNLNHIITYAIGLGLLGGPIIAAIFSSCSEVLQGQYVPEMFTAFRVGLGLGCITGPFCAGAIYDRTHTFYTVYIVSSVTYCCCAILYSLIILLNKYQPKCVFPECDPEKTAICMETRHKEVTIQNGGS